MSSNFSTYWRGLANGTSRNISGRLLLPLLIPLSLTYSIVMWLRAFLYSSGMLAAKRLPRPVVSVGNITVGGTGKTPVAAWLARKLMEQGHRVAVLSRGYGGRLEGKNAIVSEGGNILLSAAECGDEPYLLAATVPGLHVVIGSNRYQAGMLAMEKLNPDIFLLDDGFQHIRLHRDMNILLLDCERPFGNGWTLPAGLLREPRCAVLRADWIIRTRCREVPIYIPGLNIPEVVGRHELRDIVPLLGGESLETDYLRGKKIVAFAGIAQPELFFDDLRRCGAEPLHTLTLPDHARYDAELVAVILDMLKTSGAAFAVTTEKDAVKMRDAQLPDNCRIMVARLDIRIEEESIIGNITNLLQKT